MPACKSVVSIFDDLKMIRPPSSYWPESANVYVFKDGGGISLFDVGCGCITSVDRLFSALKSLDWGSRPVKKIILSHAHPDHMGAMEILSSEVSPNEIILHEIDAPYALDPESLSLSFDIPLCKERWAGGRDGAKEGMKGIGFNLIAYFRSLGCSMCSVTPTRTVVEGDTIPVGDYFFQVFHTPGHAPGHISLYDPGKRLLLAGDILGEMVAWYAPSSGGAEGYLESLQRIGNLDIDLVLPSHGSVIVDARKSIQETREKILQKDQVIVKALQTGPKTFWELNRLLFNSPSIQFFPGTPILESHLQKLKKEGKIRHYLDRLT
ncbi:MAG TPA: MBL fold metallo-hydrolase [Deltaproteobacteria bacterium]|nr:MBL fold metallo-hydrolase [Deltaproteobacteria bacterium]